MPHADVSSRIELTSELVYSLLQASQRLLMFRPEHQTATVLQYEQPPQASPLPFSSYPSLTIVIRVYKSYPFVLQPDNIAYIEKPLIVFKNTARIQKVARSAKKCTYEASNVFHASESIGCLKARCLTRQLSCHYITTGISFVINNLLNFSINGR